MFLKITIFFASLLLCAGPLQAETSISQAKYTYDGVDITPLVEYLRQEVVTLPTPITVYNWSPNGKNFDQGDRSFAARGSAVFWSSLGSEEGQNSMYGLGLYAATDPVITVGYGGGGNDWLLTEMKLPAGFVFVDVTLGAGRKEETPQKVLDISRALDCGNASRGEHFFAIGGYGLSVKCVGLAKTIYRDFLKIDGVAYLYDSMSFKICKSAPSQHRAFVVTSSRWMTPLSVQSFTANTQDRLQERRLIQSLFLSLEGNPTAATIAQTPSKRPLLWPDLQGTAKSENLDEWIRANIFACNGLPYGR